MSEEDAPNAGDGEKKDGNALTLSFSPTITKLLDPLATYVGGELRDGVALLVEKAKSFRRARNLEAHLAAVSDEAASIDDEQQLLLFPQWIEGVQDVNPDDEELSAIWRSLLTKKGNGTVRREDALKALRKVSPEAAATLMSWKRKNVISRSFHWLFAESDQRKSLEAAGFLARHNPRRRAAFAFAVAILAAYLLAPVFTTIQGVVSSGNVAQQRDAQARTLSKLASMVLDHHQLSGSARSPTMRSLDDLRMHCAAELDGEEWQLAERLLLRISRDYGRTVGDVPMYDVLAAHEGLSTAHSTVLGMALAADAQEGYLSSRNLELSAFLIPSILAAIAVIIFCRARKLNLTPIGAFLLDQVEVK